jgi:polyisoprenoid-binding protein YceI
MSVLEHRAQVVPTGTWRADRVHSTLEFAVRHMVVATFRGRLRNFDAVLTTDEAGGAVLEGTGEVASVATEEPNLDATWRRRTSSTGSATPRSGFARTASSGKAPTTSSSRAS